MRLAKNTDEDQTPAEKLALAAIEEARMVLPGIQALFGFQLIAAFNQQFHDLSPDEQLIHYIALLLVAIAIAIIMTPAAYHRIAESGSMSPFFVSLASSLVAAAMLPLMIALCIDVYLLGRVILGKAEIAGAIGITLFVLFGLLWYAFPLAMYWRRSRNH
jgi:hypothetical protein